MTDWQEWDVRQSAVREDDGPVVQQFIVTVVKPPRSGLSTDFDIRNMLTSDLQFDDQCQVRVDERL